MEAITAEVVDTKTKQDARGRKIADEERRVEVLGGYEVSGLTQKAYARREGVNYHTFVAWLILTMLLAGIDLRSGCRKAWYEG